MASSGLAQPALVVPIEAAFEAAGGAQDERPAGCTVEPLEPPCSSGSTAHQRDRMQALMQVWLCVEACGVRAAGLLGGGGMGK